MRTIKLVVLALLLTFTVNAQKSKQIKSKPILETLRKTDSVFIYETLENGFVEVGLSYKDETKGKSAMDKEITSIVWKTILATEQELKEERKNSKSYIPSAIHIYFKYKENGKHNFVVTHIYYFTYWDGNKVQDFSIFTF